MKENGNILKNTAILSLGRVVGFGLSFFIPFFLSRWLPIEEYGTYKQIMLVWMFLYQVANWGMDEGLFFFIKSSPEKKSVFSVNTIIFDFAVTFLISTTLLLFPETLASLLNNQDIIQYIPLFAILILVSIPIQHFEHLLVTSNEIKKALIFEVSYELSKSLIVLLGFFYLKNLNYILIGLITLSLIKFIIVCAYIKNDFNKYKLKFKHIKYYLPRQISHGLPLGGARFFNTIVYFDKLIISTLFTVTQFTIYSVGCFEIPIILGISVTIWDLTAMDMVPAFLKKNTRRLKEMWQFTINKIMQFYIPICVYFFLFATEIITFIFSNTYIESVPYFKIYILIFMLYSLNFEAVFRSFSANSELLKIQFFNLILSGSLIIGLGYYLGPLYALAGKLMATIVVTFLMFKFMARKMDLTLLEIVDFNKISKLFTISLSLGLLVRMSSSLLSEYLFFKLAISFSLYSLSIFLIFYRFNIFTKTENEYIKKKLQILSFKCMN